MDLSVAIGAKVTSILISNSQMRVAKQYAIYVFTKMTFHQDTSALLMSMVFVMIESNAMSYSTVLTLSKHQQFLLNKKLLRHATSFY